MSLDFVQKLAGVRDLKKILETTVKELGESFGAESCQIMLSNPLDPNVTSICEFRSSPTEEEIYGLPSVTMPLVLHGRTFGALAMSRTVDVSQDEVNAMRVVLGELGDLIRHAQINDIVQRDTFRDTFLVEIGNLMAYSLGIGDALFMVVNILGKVLQASRCLFICTDDTQAGWKCYEFWQQDKVQSCQDFRWPTTDSPLIAQTLLSEAPLNVYEGRQNSYVSPVQEELQFIGVKSLLGVALRSSVATHGCVILQQCDYRRSWTRNEIDMVQNVADKVADALLKLPAEKRAREPIMQLHQRIVAVPEESDGARASYDLRRALKGALGQQAIPSARATSAPPPPPKKVPPPPLPTPVSESAPAPTPPPPPVTPPPPTPAATVPPAAAAQGPVISPVQSRATTEPAQAKSLGSILSAGVQPPTPAPEVAAPAAARSGDDPYADLDFGDFGEGPEPAAAASAAQAAALSAAQAAGKPADPDSTWGNLDAMPMTGSLQPETGPAPLAASTTPATPPPPVPPLPTPSATQAPNPFATHLQNQNQFETVPPGVAIGQQVLRDQALTPAAGAAVGSPAAIPPLPNVAAAPNVVAAAAAAVPAVALAGVAAGGGGGGGGGWDMSALDSIQAPSSAPVKAGLGGSMMGKARASAGSSPLKASFGKSRGQQGGQDATMKLEAIDEKAAEAKVKQLVSTANSETSDYIFATPGLDMRTLSRIEGWVTEIEQKDKYANGHARQVAEYACAIAKEAGLGATDIEMVRQAALVHDLGKRFASAQILQKPDEELSDPELIMVMKHPIEGAEQLEAYPELQRLAPIVRAHHEEFNGNGYPQGLKGDEIPVAARIIHVANSYHNMTSPMRYGAGMKPADAQQELVKGAGKQWDPTYVQSLIQAIMSQKVPSVF